MRAATTRAPNVVIVGAALGGLAAERAPRRLPAAVTVVDAHDYAAIAARRLRSRHSRYAEAALCRPGVDSIIRAAATRKPAGDGHPPPA